jgi:hypothetical protein
VRILLFFFTWHQCGLTIVNDAFEIGGVRCGSFMTRPSDRGTVDFVSQAKRSNDSFGFAY